MLRAYAALAIVFVMGGLYGLAYVNGRTDGSEAASAKCQARALEDAQDASRALEAIQQQLREREAKWVKQQQEAANAVAQVRVEYLPGKTVVKREIVREPVYRTCVVSPGMRDTINSALAGRPVPGAAEVESRHGRLPADA